MLKNYFTTNISKKQASDTGMAMVLILLIIAMLTENSVYSTVAILVLIINMIIPYFFYPAAIVWLGFSHLLGTVMSKIILSIVFVLMVVPIGLFRKLIGKDVLKLKKFKKSTQSVLITRNYKFQSSDLEKPF